MIAQQCSIKLSERKRLSNWYCLLRYQLSFFSVGPLSEVDTSLTTVTALDLPWLSIVFLRIVLFNLEGLAEQS